MTLTQEEKKVPGSCPSRIGSVDRTSADGLKDPEFDSRQGHIPPL